jgi:hypothetical protein
VLKIWEDLVAKELAREVHGQGMDSTPRPIVLAATMDKGGDGILPKGMDDFTWCTPGNHKGVSPETFLLLLLQRTN